MVAECAIFHIEAMDGGTAGRQGGRSAPARLAGGPERGMVLRPIMWCLPPWACPAEGIGPACRPAGHTGALAACRSPMSLQTTALSAAPAGPSPSAAPRLRGDLAIWLLILAELLTFAILFVSYAFARAGDPQGFAQSQATLDLRFGAVNTVLLITGSAGVARAVQALRRDAVALASRWWLVALACGLGFLSLKSLEFADKAAAGVGLSTNTFYMFYLLLTGFHFLHVLLGTLFIVILWVNTRRGVYGRERCHVPETGAAFWHMVDLLWIVLFPLIYVMR